MKQSKKAIFNKLDGVTHSGNGEEEKQKKSL